MKNFISRAQSVKKVNFSLFVLNHNIFADVVYYSTFV